MLECENIFPSTQHSPNTHQNIIHPHSDSRPTVDTHKNLSTLPLQGTFLAFDFGTERIGVAVGNSISATAQALTTVRGNQNEQRFAALATLINEWQPAALIVGLPCHPDGAPHEMTRLCQRFARRLKGRFNLPVILVDERYTSTAASAQLNDMGIRGIKQKPLLDQYAAQQILQAYFNEPAMGIMA